MRQSLALVVVALCCLVAAIECGGRGSRGYDNTKVTCEKASIVANIFATMWNGGIGSEALTDSFFAPYGVFIDQATGVSSDSAARKAVFQPFFTAEEFYYEFTDAILCTENENEYVVVWRSEDKKWGGDDLIILNDRNEIIYYASAVLPINNGTGPTTYPYNWPYGNWFSGVCSSSAPKRVTCAKRKIAAEVFLTMWSRDFNVNAWDSQFTSNAVYLDGSGYYSTSASRKAVVAPIFTGASDKIDRIFCSEDENVLSVAWHTRDWTFAGVDLMVLNDWNQVVYYMSTSYDLNQGADSGFPNNWPYGRRYRNDNCNS